MNPAARALLARYSAAEVAERCVAAEAERDKLRMQIKQTMKAMKWYDDMLRILEGGDDE